MCKQAAICCCAEVKQVTEFEQQPPIIFHEYIYLLFVARIRSLLAVVCTLAQINFWRNRKDKHIERQNKNNDLNASTNFRQSLTLGACDGFVTAQRIIAT